jgi:integrase
LTIADALARGREILTAAVLNGRDLVAEERAAKVARQVDEANTVKAMFVRYLALDQVKKERSYTQKARYLLKTYWEPLHDFNAETIHQDDVWPVLERIARDSGAPTANRVNSCLSSAFNTAIAMRWLKRTTSPTVGLHRWPEAARDRFFSREEIPVLWHAGPKFHPAFGDQIKLMFYTFCRRREISRVSVREVNFHEELIELPAERCKNGLPHIIPLAPPALEILKRWIPFAQPDGRLFPVVDEGRSKTRLDELVKFAEHYVIEDIRRTCSTGVREWLRPCPDEPLIDLLMNHVRGASEHKSGARGVYNRAKRLDERREVLERWARFIQNLVGETTEPAHVIALPR